MEVKQFAEWFFCYEALLYKQFTPRETSWKVTGIKHVHVAAERQSEL